MMGGGDRTESAMARGRSARTTHARKTFLAVLAERCNVSEACRTAGIGRATAYEWRDADPAFAADWAEAEEQAADRLERIAWERAESGESDRMLEILLKAHRPKYREKQAVEVSGYVQVDHTIEARRELADLFGPTPHEILIDG